MAMLGLTTQGLNDIAERVLGLGAVARLHVPSGMKRVVILGGGFAGMRRM